MLYLGLENFDGKPFFAVKTGLAKMVFFWQNPRVGSGVVRIDPLRLLAGCHKR